MATDMAQHEHNNNKYYASTFIYIYIYIYKMTNSITHNIYTYTQI